MSKKIPADWSKLSQKQIEEYIEYLLENIDNYTLTRRGFNTIIIEKKVEMHEQEGSHGFDYIKANGALLFYPHRIYALYGTCEELIKQNKKEAKKQKYKNQKQLQSNAQMALLQLMHTKGDINDAVYQKYAINNK